MNVLSFALRDMTIVTMLCYFQLPHPRYVPRNLVRVEKLDVGLGRVVSMMKTKFEVAIGVEL